MASFLGRRSGTALAFAADAESDGAGNPTGWTELYRWDKSLGQASGVLTSTAISGGVQQFPDTPNPSITLTDPAIGPRQFRRRVIEKAP